jgi:hypothetical protein
MGGLGRRLRLQPMDVKEYNNNNNSDTPLGYSDTPLPDFSGHHIFCQHIPEFYSAEGHPASNSGFPSKITGFSVH